MVGRHLVDLCGSLIVWFMLVDGIVGRSRLALEDNMSHMHHSNTVFSCGFRIRK